MGAGLLGTLVAVSFLVGCSTPKIDWAKRIGNYTMDQAVLEFGPPDKQAQLQDNTIVAEWLMRRGHSYHYPLYGYYSGYYGPGYPAYSEGYTPDSFLRLTFGPDGKLQAFKKFYR
jgi:hypothetical protein